MAKYIDADSLRKEVKRLEKAAHIFALGCADSETRKFHEGKDFAYQNVGILIDSLQQEQPEVELETEIATWIPAHIKGDVDKDIIDAVKRCGENVARHFYELGKNSK